MNLEAPSAYFLHDIYWGNGLSYRRGWRTTIMRSIANTEQRSTLNFYIRRIIGWDVITRNQEEMYYLKKILFRFLHKVWGVPIWPYEMVLSSNHTSGSILNVVTTANRKLNEGASPEIIIMSDYKTYEVGSLSSYNATSITLSSPPTNDWPAGTKVYPSMRCSLGNYAELVSKVPRILHTRVEFVEEYRGDSYS